MTSTGASKAVVMEDCSDDDKESQIVEFGQEVDGSGPMSSQPCQEGLDNTVNKKLVPISRDLWKKRMKRLRNKEMNESLGAVNKVVDEIRKMNKTGELYRVSGNRRGIVFYVDKGDGFLAYLTWWLYA